MNKKVRKRLLYAVTHGKYIKFIVFSYRGGRCVMIADTPKKLKSLLNGDRIEIISYSFINKSEL